MGVRGPGVSVFGLPFASLHFTDNVEDLVSRVAVGLTFKVFPHNVSSGLPCFADKPKLSNERSEI